MVVEGCRFLDAPWALLSGEGGSEVGSSVRSLNTVKTCNVCLLLQHLTFHVFEFIDSFTETSIDRVRTQPKGFHFSTLPLLLCSVFKQHFGTDLQLFLQVISIVCLLLLFVLW